MSGKYDYTHIYIFVKHSIKYSQKRGIGGEGVANKSLFYYGFFLAVFALFPANASANPPAPGCVENATKDITDTQGLEPDRYSGRFEAGIDEPAYEEYQHDLRDNGGAPDKGRGGHEKTVPEPVKRGDIDKRGEKDENKQ